MPTIRSYFYRSLKLALAIGFLALAIGFAFTYSGKLFDDTNCKNYNYNDKLNGGVKEFNGKKYSINICGSGVSSNGFFGSSYDSVLLSITDDEGHLVAKRHYKVFWDGQPGHEPLAISSNSITYQDDKSETEHVISMPPTFFERMMAYIR